MTIRAIQRALAERGYPVGPIDGIYGRRTIAAVRAFQADHRLEVDGIVGPQTMGALGAVPSVGGAGAVLSGASLFDGALPWFQEARRLLGVREKPGAANNQVILDWADNLDIAFDADEVPWCGLFVAHCVGATLSEENLPANPLGARSWMKFGIGCSPTVGAVLVFWRGTRNGWKGHVGFYSGEDASAYRVLGGNQGDAVSLVWIAKDRLLGARWPAAVAVREGSLTVDSRSEGLSTDEA